MSGNFESFGKSLPTSGKFLFPWSLPALAKVISRTIGFKGEIKFDQSKPDGAHKKLLDSSRLRKICIFDLMNLDVGLKNSYNDFLFRYSKNSS